jgi:hypothetical protein
MFLSKAKAYFPIGSAGADPSQLQQLGTDCSLSRLRRQQTSALSMRATAGALAT